MPSLPAMGREGMLSIRIFKALNETPFLERAKVIYLT